MNAKRSTGRGNLLLLMGCKHCSFKSYCIKPWIPSITKLQNGNKEEKNTSSSLLDSPSGGSPAGQATGSPSPTPSQRSREACTGEPGTDLGPQASPTSGDQGQGRELPSTLPSRPEPRDPLPKFQAGLGPARLPQPLALPHLPGPPWSAPCPARPGARSGDGAHLVPTHPSRTWFRLQEPKQGGQRRNPAGREEENIPETHTSAHAPAARRGEAAGSAGTPPAGHLAARWAQRGGQAGTLRPRGPAAGRGNADSQRPALGGARLSGLPRLPSSQASHASPAPTGPTLSSGHWGRAAGSAAAPGGAFVPERGGVCSKGLRLPLPRLGFLI